MKKITSLLLAVLMILPMFVFFSYANGVEATSSTGTHEGENIATDAELKYYSKQTEEEEPSYVDISVTTPKTDYSKVNDGDITTGTNTGRTSFFAFELNYDQIYFFTDVVLHLNGNGTTPDGVSVSNSNSIDKVVVNLYKSGELVKSINVETLNQTEVTVSVEVAADTIEVYRDQKKLSTSNRGTDFFREIETYQVERDFCNVVKSNIASEALVYAAGTTENDYCDTWWAWNPKALVDGKDDVGTHSPKGWNYSVFVDYTQDYLISELILTVNGKGYLDDGSGIKIEEAAMNVSQIRVLLYNLDGEEVYNSKSISVDSTKVKIDPFVEACRVKIEIANGKGEGSEFLWEIETYVEEGQHIFEETGSSNPTCNRPGYKEFSCHCGKVIKKAVPATGFHSYDEGVVTTPATATENGVLTKTCVNCLGTADFDIPATGHNWDAGVTTDPTCEADGSTVYTCTGCSVDGCNATYVSDVVSALGHDWNDGEITKKATLTEHGEKKLTCLRKECGKVETRQTRKLQYTDSTTQFDFDSIEEYVVAYEKNEGKNPEEIVTQYNESPTATYPLQDPKNLLDDDMMTYWHGTIGTTYTITLDREYIFTKGTLFASGNNVTLRFDWIDESGKITASYETKWNTINNGADKSDPMSISMTEPISSGAKAKTIKITITGSKWENGYTLALHGLDFVVHSCVVDESDYVLSGPYYTAPTCTNDGACIAKCPVCTNEIDVILPSSDGHVVTEVTTDLEPTCSTPGHGHGTCTAGCGQVIYNVEIPALGTHDYRKEIDFMPATCGAKGIRQLVCVGCDRVGSQYPIDATGAHDYEWVEDYCSTYTHEGKEVFICTGCGLGGKEEESGISERVIDKKEVASEFVTFVGKTNNKNGSVTFTFKINLDNLDDVEYECDVRIITYITDANGVETTVESYGKYSHNKRTTDKEGQISSTVENIDGCEVRTVVRLMNFRGVEFVDVAQ